MLICPTARKFFARPTVCSRSQSRNLKTAAIGRRKRNRHTKPGKTRLQRFKMGQESSSPVDESIPPQTLKDRTLGSVADFIRDGHAKNIVVMVGSLRSDKAGGFLG